MKPMFQIAVDYLVAHGATSIRVFGSRARGDERPDSDLDILVEFSKVPSLLKLIAYEQELSDKIGVKVDLLTEKAISPLVMPYVKKDILTLYQ